MKEPVGKQGIIGERGDRGCGCGRAGVVGRCGYRGGGIVGVIGGMVIGIGGRC